MRAGKGYRIIYVGHEGHEEAVGTMAVAPDSIDRVQSVADVDALDDIDEPVALLAQTTLSHRDWEGVAVAVKQSLPRGVDARPQRPLLRHHQPPGGVDGTRPPVRRDRRARLGQLVQHAGARTTRPRGRLSARRIRVNGVDELPDDLAGIVGVTAGASAPEELVAEVLEFLAPGATGSSWSTSPTRTSTSRRRATSATCRLSIETASTVMLGGSLLDRPGMDDRSVGASDVLTALCAVSD